MARASRRGMFLPLVLTAAMLAGILFTALLAQLTATSRNLVRIQDRDQATLLAESVLRLRKLPAGASTLSLAGTGTVEVMAAPDGSRSATARVGAAAITRRSGPVAAR